MAGTGPEEPHDAVRYIDGVPDPAAPRDLELPALQSPTAILGGPERPFQAVLPRRRLVGLRVVLDRLKTPAHFACRVPTEFFPPLAASLLPKRTAYSLPTGGAGTRSPA